MCVLSRVLLLHLTCRSCCLYNAYSKHACGYSIVISLIPIQRWLTITLEHALRRKFDFFPKGTAGADGWMSLYFKFADQFSDNQQIGFGFKLHVINFQFPSQTLTKGMRSNNCCLLACELFRSVIYLIDVVKIQCKLSDTA